MKRYRPLFLLETRTLREKREQRLYESYCRWCNATDYGRQLSEISIWGPLKEVIDFIKEIAKEVSLKFFDLLKLFKNKGLFRVFNSEAISWSLEKLWTGVKKAFALYKKIIAAWRKFQSKVGAIIDQKVLQGKTTEVVQLFDDFLAAHPWIKKISGVMLGFLLLYMLFNGTYTGFDLESDFDITTVVRAFTGNLTLSQVFGGPDGHAFVLMFFWGFLGGVSMPWPGANIVKFGVGALIALGKYVGTKVSKVSAGENEKEIRAVEESLD